MKTNLRFILLATLAAWMLLITTSCNKDKKAAKNQRDIELYFYSGGDSAIFTYTLPSGATETITSYGKQNNEHAVSLKYPVDFTIHASAQTVNVETQSKPTTQVFIKQLCDCDYSGGHTILDGKSEYTYSKLEVTGVVVDDNR